MAVRLGLAAFATVGLLASSTPAFAVSGAEFMKMPWAQREGFAWGLVDALTTYVDPQESPASAVTAISRHNCLASSKIDSHIFYTALERQITADPANLTQQVESLVVITLSKMCPE